MLQPFATAAQEASAIIYIVPMRRRTGLLAGWVRFVVFSAPLWLVTQSRRVRVDLRLLSQTVVAKY